MGKPDIYELMKVNCGNCRFSDRSSSLAQCLAGLTQSGIHAIFDEPVTKGCEMAAIPASSDPKEFRLQPGTMLRGTFTPHPNSSPVPIQLFRTVNLYRFNTSDKPFFYGQKNRL